MRRALVVWMLVAGTPIPTLAQSAAGQPPAPVTSAAAADQPMTLSLEDLLSLEAQSVFGASKFLQKLSEAPATVSIVTAEDIERYGWLTLADVLRSVRGFYVTDDRAWAYAGTRGFLRPGDYNTRILLTVDGHRANDNMYDQAAVQEDFMIDLFDVERIEIIRGPASSLYGSNAFFGVINLVTKSARDHGPVKASFNLGTLGRRVGRLSAGRDFKSGLGVGVSATFQDMKGMEQLYFPEYDTPGSSFGVASGLDFTRRQNVFGTATYGQATVRAGFNSRKRGLPTAAYETAFNDGRANVNDTHAFVDAGWERPLRAGWAGRFRAAYDYYSYVGEYPYDVDGDSETAADIYTDKGTGEWVTGEFQLSGRVAGRHRVTAGVEYRANFRQSQLAYYDRTVPDFGHDGRSSTVGLYAQDEIRLHPTLLINVGLRYDQYSAFANPLKPRLAAVYQAAERTTVKFLFGQAFRAPNAFEVHYETPGIYKANEDLRPEAIRTTEAVVEHYLGRRVRVIASVFAYRLQDLLDLRPDPADGLLWYQNVDSVTANGFEGEVEAKWPGGAHARLSYTNSQVRDSARDERLTNSPSHVTQALFSMPLAGKTTVGLDLRALSGRLTRSGEALGGHVIANVTVAGPFFDPRLRFSGTMANLTNRQYSDPVAADFVQEAVAQNGRTAYLRLIWEF